MNIYISGISGTGMGPLALMAKAAGMKVFGSDLARGAIYDELINAGIEVYIGEQDGKFLEEKLSVGVDWFVYTSALPSEHAELVLAKKEIKRVSKRDELTAFLIDELGLKMVAVAGTHGKTTTTAMIVFLASRLGFPVSYIVGTTLGFLPSGSFKEGDKYFVYEADEYDRNFLKYSPWVSVIPFVSYDHPDIYPTKESYLEAFSQFKTQSEKTIETSSTFSESDFKLAGEARRRDAALAGEAGLLIAEDLGKTVSKEEIIRILDEFPGVSRRFEKIKDGIYTDYAHHPEEIQATIGVVKDEKRLHEKKGIVVVYQPHQNTRQHEVRGGYYDAFDGADKVFWLPTYLTRENPDLAVITPEEFISGVKNPEIFESAEMNEELVRKLRDYYNDDYLIILMSAGPADKWFREITEAF